MNILTRPILEINYDNLLSNYISLTKAANEAIPAAVIKDDAYGLGAKSVASVLYTRANCRHFFVAHAVEGEKIVENAQEAKIYVLQGIGNDNLDVFQKHHQLIPVISSQIVSAASRLSVVLLTSPSLFPFSINATKS